MGIITKNRQKHLLRFIKAKLRYCGDIPVICPKNGKPTSLKEVFEELNLRAYDLSIDTLNMHGQRDSFHRFDRFNAKYNPIGQPKLRQVYFIYSKFTQFLNCQNILIKSIYQHFF